MKINDIVINYRLKEYKPFWKYNVLNDTLLNMEIFIVVLTGGPCAGKTTCINKARRQTMAIPDCATFFAQEAATHLKNANINYVSAGADETFQRLIIDHQLTSERDVVISAIKYKSNHPDEKVICIFDRSIMDGQAYFKDPDDFVKIMKDYKLTPEAVYARSDMVIFLRTAALGAKHAYTTSDGTPRDETPEQAIVLDKNVYNAWKGHPNFKKIDNRFIFSEKMDRAIHYIFGLANIDVPVFISKRMIIDMPDLFVLHTQTENLKTCFDQTFFMRDNANHPTLYTSLHIRRDGDNINYDLAEQRWEKVLNPQTHMMVEAPAHDVLKTIAIEDVPKHMLNIRADVKPLERIVYNFNISDAISCELSQYSCNPQYAFLKVKFICDATELPMLYEMLNARFHIRREVTFDRRYSEFKIAESNGEVLATV